MSARRRAVQITATLRGRKGGKRKKENDSDSDDDHTRDILSIAEEAPSSTAKRATDVEKILNKRTDRRQFVVDPASNKVLTREKQIDGLLEKVEERIYKSRKYANAFSLVAFMLLYLIMIFMQNDVLTAYNIESSAQNQISLTLPPSFVLETPDDFWGWLSDSVVGKVFTDPSCGDGVCDPGESKGFGRFGCAADCGRFLQVTPITIDLIPFMNATRDINPRWSWENVPQRVTPEYRWNIWSETMNDYIFEKDQPAGKGKVVVEVPDGKLQLKLYQTNKVSEAIDATTIKDYLRISQPTLPLRVATDDFAFGDPREVIASAALVFKQLQDYCWSIQPGSEQQTFLMNCLLHPIPDSMFKSMASYGLQGKISMANGTKEVIDLVKVEMCGLLPNGTQGIANPSNKELFQAARAPCVGRRDGSSDILGDDDVFSMLDDAPWLSSQHSDALMDASEVEAHGARRAAKSGYLGPCKKHLDCDATVADPISGKRGLFCHADGTCNPCAQCNWDVEDSIDRACPLSICLGSGLMPQCIDAQKLVPYINKPKICKDTYNFEVWKFNKPGSTVSVGEAPTEKVRWVTPFNRLVGPLTVSTTRVKKGACSVVQNRDVQNFTLGQCVQADVLDGTPMGKDPTYIATSPIYNGKLDVTRYYENSERYNRSIVRLTTEGYKVVLEPTTPYGFFPHQYDQIKHAEKPADLVVEEFRDHFKCYFDGTGSASQALAQLQYLKDSNFINSETSTVTVEMITFNAQINMFMLLSYSFWWKQGGTIEWDYTSNTVFMDLYTGKDPTGSRFALEVIVILALIFNVYLEISDIFAAVRKMSLSTYLSHYGNWFDWGHFIFMAAGWWMWFTHHAKTSAFQMEESYPVNADVGAPSRFFATNATNEHTFLMFQNEVRARSDDLALYRALVGICIVCFVMRVLKVMDFQPRLGLVTRTVTAALPDLLHFVFLFMIVFVGYAICANLLFGHQFDRMYNVPSAVLYLLFITFSMDKTSFYDQMSHAAPPWIFHLWLWTFTVVGYLVLFNIFLAILVDSYFAMKEDVDKEFHRGVPEEIDDFVRHKWNCFFKKKNVFMSDEKVRDVLLQHKAGLPSARSVRQSVLDTIDHKDVVMLPGGIEVDRKWMWRLTHVFVDPLMVAGKVKDKMGKTLDMIAAADPHAVVGDESSDEEEVHGLDDETSEMIQDLIDRYNNEVRLDQVAVEDGALDLMKIDNMKRAMGMFRVQQKLNHRLSKMEILMEGMMHKMLDMDKPENKVPRHITHPDEALKAKKEKVAEGMGTVKIIVVQAENLPTMDLLRSVDPYALVFLTNTDGDCEAQEATVKTTVQRKNRHPIWNEEFVLFITTESAALTVTIYDKDNITKDDFVGCCFIPLADLDPYNEHDDWYPVLNPNLEMEDARIRLKVTLQSAKVTAVSPSNAKKTHKPPVRSLTMKMTKSVDPKAAKILLGPNSSNRVHPEESKNGGVGGPEAEDGEDKGAERV